MLLTWELKPVVADVGRRQRGELVSISYCVCGECGEIEGNVLYEDEVNTVIREYRCLKCYSCTTPISKMSAINKYISKLGGK